MLIKIKYVFPRRKKQKTNELEVVEVHINFLTDQNYIWSKCSNQQNYQLLTNTTTKFHQYLFIFSISITYDDKRALIW